MISMVKLIRMQEPASLNFEKALVESSGAKYMINNAKGSATLKSSKLGAHPLKVYDALVRLVDSNGLDGKKEVKTDRKSYIELTKAGCGAVMDCYKPKPADN